MNGGDGAARRIYGRCPRATHDTEDRDKTWLRVHVQHITTIILRTECSIILYHTIQVYLYNTWNITHAREAAAVSCIASYSCVPTHVVIIVYIAPYMGSIVYLRADGYDLRKNK